MERKEQYVMTEGEKTLPRIFWLDIKGEIVSGDTHTNLIKQRMNVPNDKSAREYAIERGWIRCRKEPNARGGYIISLWEMTPSARRRLENVFEVGQVVEIESLKIKRMEAVVL